MYAIILCAGLGVRLNPITKLYAKPALKVINKSLVEWTIENLIRSGINKILITTYHRPESIENLDLANKYRNCSIQILREDHLLGTGGGIRNAMIVGGLDDAVLVLNGDCLWDFDLTIPIEKHNSRNMSGVLTMLLVNSIQENTPVYIDNHGAISKIGGISKDLQSFTHSGISIISTEGQRSLLLEAKEYFVDDFVVPWVQRKRVFAEIMDGFWADLGTPKRYLNETIRFASYKGIYSQFLAGKNCSIHPSATLLNSILWDNVTVGPKASLTNSIILTDTTIPSGFIATNKVIFPGSLQEQNHLSDFF